MQTCPQDIIQLKRSIHFQDQLSPTSFTKNLPLNYIVSLSSINLSTTFDAINCHFQELEDCHIFYIEPERHMQVYLGIFPFAEEVLLKYPNWSLEVLEIRYRKINSDSKNKLPEATLKNQSGNKRKAAQRTIKQVRDCVNAWKKLYNQCSSSKKGALTMNAVAQGIGIPKKSLYDYARQIQRAEKLQFNFMKWQNEKMGILRNFVKENIYKLKNSPDTCQQLNFFDTDLYWDIPTDSK